MEKLKGFMAFCKMCGKVIMHNGKHWGHVDYKPRHPAIPRDKEKYCFHVHVYQVSVLGEVDVNARNNKEAKEIALDMARKGEVSLRFPDCGMIAVTFEDD